MGGWETFSFGCLGVLLLILKAMAKAAPVDIPNNTD